MSCEQAATPDGGGGRRALVVLSTDLMDRSRFVALGSAGVAVHVARSAEQLAAVVADLGGHGGGATVAVAVDLSRPDALDAVVAAASAGVRVVAYGSHVDRPRLDAAHAAGAEVLARSAFFSRLADLFA